MENTKDTQPKIRERLNLTLPKDLVDYVRALAKKRYTSANAIIIMMIVFYMENNKEIITILAPTETLK